jgi:hypothetical protein
MAFRFRPKDPFQSLQQLTAKIINPLNKVHSNINEILIVFTVLSKTFFHNENCIEIMLER